MRTELTVKKISQRIYFIRDCRVMLDTDLAQLYEVKTKNLNKAVRRNLERFPEDFMFQVTEEEFKILRFQIGTSKTDQELDARGGRRYLPLVFTEHGVAMLSSVLKSPQAALVNIEKKYDSQFKVVFDALRELMTPPDNPKRKIGIK